MKKSQPGKDNNGRYRWAATVFFMAVSVSGLLTLASETVLDGAGTAVALALLALFIGLGILFDMIGVAVTAADARPFHAMAAHKEKGAKEALRLMKNADRVSSVCNDVVGDICGIVSGATGAVIAAQLQAALSLRSVLVSVGVTAVISGMTIGGKALAKTVAMRKSTQVVYLVGRVLHVFHR